MNLKVSIPIIRKESETTKAIKFVFVDPTCKTREVSHWIPISQVYEIHPNRVVIADWIAKEKGLI